MFIKLPKDPYERLNSQISNKTEISGDCVIWTGHLYNGNTPMIKTGRNKKATSVYEILLGSPVRFEHLIFSCTSKSCLNIEHFRRKTVIDKFEENVNRTIGLGPKGDCWKWEGSTYGNLITKGYGRFTLYNIRYVAHQVSWQIHNNKLIPDGLLMCHTCDWPSCVNPNHLYAGTVKQNTQDAIDRNRMNYPVGSAHHSAKTTEAEVKEMRRLAAGGLRPYEVQKLFPHMSWKQTSDIIKGKAWVHVGV